MSKIINDFKVVGVRCIAVEMVVGVVYVVDFGIIESSSLNDIIMPPIGWLIGGVNFSDLKFELPTVKIAGEELAAATINYGAFIQTIIDFTIIAFCVFMLVKGINKLAKKKKKEEAKAPAAPPAPSKEEVLLTEIRDAIKELKK